MSAYLDKNCTGLQPTCDGFVCSYHGDTRRPDKSVRQHAYIGKQLDMLLSPEWEGRWLHCGTANLSVWEVVATTRNMRHPAGYNAGIRVSDNPDSIGDGPFKISCHNPDHS